MSNKLTNQKLIKTYYILFAVSAITFFVMMYITNGQSFTNTIFRDSLGSDYFMDFFNSIRDGSTKEVYKNRIIYPPLANLFFYILSNMIDPELATASFPKRYLLARDYTCLFLYFVFVILCMIMLVGVTKKYLEKHNLQRFSLTLPVLLLFSYPMIYCIQRGNIALLSLVFTMFFVFYRDSENKFLRELSFVLLAIAAGIKLYPAVFGLLLITDRKFKQAFRLIIYGLIFFIVPFFFYDGIESIIDLYNNLGRFSDKSSGKISPAFVCVNVLAMYANMLLKIDYTVIYNFLVTVTYLSAASILIFSPKQWQKVWAICYMIMNYQSTGRTYILVFAIIPFIMFIASEKFRKRDVPYFIIFLLVLLVIPPVYFTQLESICEWVSNNLISSSGLLAKNLKFLGSPNQMMAAFLVTGMTMYMFVDTLIGIAKNEIVLFKKKTK